MITGLGNDNHERYLAPTRAARQAAPAHQPFGRPTVSGAGEVPGRGLTSRGPFPLGPAARAAWMTAMIVALAAVGWAIYSISQGMRTVMLMGGSCASAGSGYDLPACPSGAGGQIVLGILGGLLASGVAGVAAARLRRRQLVLFAWPALFALLGWNFLEFAMRPAAAGAASRSTNWLICGLLFELMAFFPLVGGVILVIRSVVRSRALGNLSR